MRYAEFSNGTKIIEGAKGIADLRKLLCGLGASRIMVVGEGSLIGDGLDKIKKAVTQGGDVSVGAVYLGDDSIGGKDALRDMYFVYMSNDCDGIVVCGGSKLIDCVKLLRLAIGTQVKDIKKFFNNSDIGRKVINVPLITIPIEFGMGSECNALALYYDEEKNLTRNIFHDLLSPDYCIIDGNMLSGMSGGDIAYGVLNMLGRAIDGFIGIRHARIGILIKRVDVYDISEVFSRVALTNLKDRAFKLLESRGSDELVKMALDSAYLAKGLDTYGMGMIYSSALAISDVKGESFSQCLPISIKASLDYNLRVCGGKYSRALWTFAGWQTYSGHEEAKRAEGFVNCVKEFVDSLTEKYIDGYEPIKLNDDDRQSIVNVMAYNPHMLNNPRHFDPLAIKAVLR